MIHRYEWGENKDAINYRKHHIHFSDVIFIFGDLYRLEEMDRSNSIDEERFITIGCVGDRFVHIAYTMRGDKIRIISARKAARAERKKYEEGVSFLRTDDFIHL